MDYETLVHVAPILADIMSEENAGGSSGERAIRAAKIRSLNEQLATLYGELAMARNLAKQYDISNPAALRYLRSLIKLHGEHSVELVPGYLALAESNMGLGPSRASSASEMLFTALSILMTAARESKDGDSAHHALHYRLYILYGRLYLSQDKLAQSVESFSKAVYFASLAGGPEHLGVAPCMYLLGSAFLRAGRKYHALSSFKYVLSVYNMHFLGKTPAFAVAVGYRPPPPAAHGSVDSAASASPLGSPLSPLEDCQALEALNGILCALEAHCGAFSVEEARWTLALVHKSAGRKRDAMEALDSLLPSFIETLVSLRKEIGSNETLELTTPPLTHSPA